MNKLLLTTLLLGLALIVPKAQAADIGVGIGVTSAAMHQEYPLETRDALQTKAGIQLKQEVLSTLISGNVDLIGNISYSNKEEMSQGLSTSSSIQKSFHGVNLKAQSVLQIAEKNSEGRLEVDNLSTSFSISREVFPEVEGRIIGGGYYNHQGSTSLLMGADIAKEILSCKVEVGLWVKEELALTGRISKEMEFHRISIGTVTDTRESKVWFEVSVSVDDLKDFQ